METSLRKWSTFMDIEELKRIKKASPRTMEKLQEEFLPRCWFICYHLTQDTKTAAPLLIQAWSKTLGRLMQAKKAPNESFLELVAAEIYSESQKDIEPNEDFADCPPPEVSPSFRVFTDQFADMDEKKRTPYLLCTFGGLSTAKMAQLMNVSSDRSKRLVQDASTEIIEHAKSVKRSSGTQLVTLSAKFRNTDGSGLAEVEVPEFVQASLDHVLSQELDVEPLPKEHVETKASKNTAASSAAKKSTGREMKTMPQKAIPQKTVSQRKRTAKIRKRIITIAVVCAIVAAGGIGLWRYSLRNNAGGEIVTTYYTEAITYGDVDSTISGSGSLTPVTNEMLSCSNPCVVDEIDVAVGDTVEEGDVIAVVTQTVTTTTVDEGTMQMSEETTEEGLKITAPCAGIVTELAAAEGDSLSAGSEIAIVLGTDTGFTVSLSVDETEIANVAIGQEATITVDAVNDEFTGEVTNLSYNGSSNGSTTSYQLTVTMDYEEGVYSGMTAATEIVIESSGDGLLVPVDAVHTSGDDSYVYLAPSDADEGTEYDEDELDLSDLTKVTITTDMSDGSYIMIESDELAEGDLIIMTEISTTATASDSDDSSSFGRMSGGMGGGDFGGGMDFGGGGGMDFGNMPAMGGQ